MRFSNKNWFPGRALLFRCCCGVNKDTAEGRTRSLTGWLIGLGLVLVLSMGLPTGAAQAACTVPNQITNGQPADATPLMGNFNALKDCANSISNSAITPSGSPAAGNLTTFSGSQTITSGDLTGDCTTAGTLVVTCTKTNGTALGYFATGTDAGQLTGTLSVNRFANGVNADATHFLRGDGVWAVPSGGGGTGGGSGLPVIYSNRDDTVLSTGAVPTSQTAFFSLTIPGSPSARTFMLSGNFVWDSNHGMRWSIQVDGTRAWPTTLQASNPGINSNTAGDGSTIITIAGVPINIPGDGASHTISLAWEAQSSTSSLTVRERSLYAMQIY